MAQVTVEPIGYPEMKHTEELFAWSMNLPFQFFVDLKKPQLCRYHFEKTNEALLAEKIRVFGAMVESRPVGLLILEKQLWDTEVLGLDCFSIRDLIVPEGPTQGQLTAQLIQFAIDHCSSNGGELLVAKADSGAQYLIRGLGLAGFELMSTLLIHVFDIRRTKVPSPKKNFTYRTLEEKDIPSVKEVAEKAFQGHFDRYTLDKRIPPERARRVHSEWVANSCRGYADQVFVAADGERVVGFGTWKIEKGTYDALGLRIARYDLAAVAPDQSGKGVYKGMASAGLQWISGKVDVINGPANIRNYPVHRGLSSLGWRIAGSSYSFHRWLT